MQPYEQLEQEFGEWIGNPNTVACSSGTAALHLALEALGLSPQSKIIIPEFTMVACARAATLANLQPVFVDCGENLLLNPDLLERSVKGARAVMPVHIYGRQCAMSRIVQFADQRGLKVIEDLAEAHGVLPHPNTDAACWSFYRNKIIHGEEGGMIAFKEQRHAELARCLRSLGFTEAHDFKHVPRGMNYRLANLLATPVIKSLYEFKDNALKRRLVELWYDELLPDEWKMSARQAVWVYDLRIPNLKQEQQDQIIRTLNGEGIQARHAFKPMSSLREYHLQARPLLATRLAREVIYLPVYPDMKREQVDNHVQGLLATVEECLVS